MGLVVKSSAEAWVEMEAALVAKSSEGTKVVAKSSEGTKVVASVETEATKSSEGMEAAKSSEGTEEAVLVESSSEVMWMEAVESSLVGTEV